MRFILDDDESNVISKVKHCACLSEVRLEGKAQHMCQCGGSRSLFESCYSFNVRFQIKQPLLCRVSGLDKPSAE